MSELEKNRVEGKPHWKRSIQNSAGELEQEMFSRKENLIEFFAAMTFILVDLWLIAYPAVLLGIAWLNTLSIVLLVIEALFLFLIGPNIHRDEFSGWGLGNPLYIYRSFKKETGLKKVLPVLIVSVIVIGLTVAAFVFWVEVADFLGISEEAAIKMKQTPSGTAMIMALALVIGFIFATVIIRYDNFLPALLTAFKIIIPLALMLLGLAYLAMGPAAFSDFNVSAFTLNFFGYIFWGAIQQLLFSSYFGTRVRKGFGPAEDPKDIKKKRFWVAFLNGSFFGLLHIPSWSLLAVTWFLGIFLSYVFMKDKNRNLIALGVIHGFLGSMLGWLFSSGKAGGAEIEMSVGPWNVDYFDISIFIVVGILVAFFTVCMIYVAKKWKE